MAIVELTSGIYGFAPDDEARTAVLDDDATQIAHVIAKWHLDEVAAAARGPRPCPVFEVVLTAAEFPFNVNWAFSRHVDLDALMERMDLPWFAARIDRPEYAREAFNPPADHVTVLHVDQVYREATDHTKLAMFTFDIAMLEDFTRRLMALPEYRRNHAPGHLHYDW